MCVSALLACLGLGLSAELAWGERAYERVSPADKNGFDVELWGLHAVSPDGDRAAFLTRAGSPGGSTGFPTPFVSVRTSTGWSARPIDATDAGAVGSLSWDLGKSILTGFSKLTPDAQNGATQLYLRDNFSNAFEMITPVPTPGRISPNITATSPDLGQIMYDHDGVAQTAVPVSGSVNAYKRVAGETRLVGVLPDGSIPPMGSQTGSTLTSGSVSRALSRDGVRGIFHANAADGSLGAGGQLYSRQDDGLVPPSTVHVSASERTDCADDPACGGDGPDPAPDPEGPLPALYWTAEAEHGTQILFTSCEKLTDDSPADASIGPSPNEVCRTSDGLQNTTLLAGRELYMYDLEANGGAGELIDLTAAALGGGRVYGVVGASETLNRIYFVAGGVLDAGAIQDRPNLYLRQDGEIRFIATLESIPTEEAADLSLPLDIDIWAVRTRSKGQEVRLSKDGQKLLITSRAQLTSYDSANDECLQDRCSEVYMYDASDDALTCVSCPPQGSKPTGDAELFHSVGAATASPDELPGNLSDNGQKVYFETPDALVTRDTNAKVDVYEWSNGVVRLISTGKSVRDSYFSDAAPNGSDVFFTTKEQLVSSDKDAVYDLYDAREGGGLPEVPEAAICQDEDACHGMPSVEPSFLAPGTNELQGPGNIIAGFRSPVRLGALSRRAKARLARGKPAAFRVRCLQRGVVSVRVKAKVQGRVRTVAKASKRVGRPSLVVLRMRLFPAARAAARRPEGLRAQITASLSGARVRQVVRLGVNR